MFFGLLLGLAAVEISARTIEPDGAADLLFNAPAYSPLDLYINDPELLLLPSPGFEGEVGTSEYSNWIRINERGLRGPPVGPKPEGTLRLLAVGDSFTMSVQVDEADLFQTRLAGVLSEKLGRPVEILNGGVDGYGTLQALGRVEHLAEALALDGAIYLFFMGNDIQDNVTYNHLARGRRSVIPRPLDYRPANQPTMQGAPDRPEIPAWQRWLATHSHAYAHVDVYLKSQNPDERALQRFRMELELFLTGSPGLRQHMTETEEAIDLAAERCEAREMRCFMAIAPAAFMIDQRRAAPTFELVGLDAARIDLDGPREAVLDVASEAMPTLDLSPALSAAAEEGSVYYRYDGHWNVRGHEVVAEAMADWMAPLLKEE